MNQTEYLIEQMAQENAKLRLELHKANFTIIALQEKINEASVEESEGE